MASYSDRSYQPARVSSASRPKLYDPTRPVSEEAFAAARRHTRRVTGLKIILPALAVTAAVVFWAAMRFIPTDFGTIAKTAGIDVNSDSVTMNKPRISGFEGTRRAYEVQAESAVQSLSDPKIVTFSKIDAKVGLDGAGTATLGAKTGVYDAHRNTLNLKDGIAITTDTGYSATVQEASIDLDKGSMVTSYPINIDLGQGSIRANAISVTERGKHVVFSGGVSMTFLPTGELAAAPGKK